jgi:hypothetical protein
MMNEFDWAGWSDWQALAALDRTHIPKGPGAYVIASDRPLHRAVGVDPLGILDIGESAGLRHRLDVFQWCATHYKYEGHMAGWRFAFFRFSRHFPVEALRVRWIAAPTKQDANEIEGRMLLCYLANHLELPPLNYSFNWRPFRKDGWDVFDRLIRYPEQSTPPRGPGPGVPPPSL